MQQSGEDELLVRTELTQDRRGAFGVARVPFAGDDEADRLLDALSHVSRRGTWRAPGPA